MIHEAWGAMTAEERVEYKHWSDAEGELQLSSLPLVFSTITLASGKQFPQHPEKVAGKKASQTSVKAFIKKRYEELSSWGSGRRD